LPASGLLRSLLADTTPLEHPHFRRLWTANIITVIGAQLNIIVVPLQIYDITDSSAYVGLAGAFGLVPLVIFGLYGGALSDRMDRTKLLRITTVGMIVTAVAFWAQAASGLDNVWLLLCVFAVQQAFFAVNQPTRTAVIARIVPLGKIGAATSLNMTVTPGRRDPRPDPRRTARPGHRVRLAVPHRRRLSPLHPLGGAEAAGDAADGRGVLR
jgi:steroid 5-alpha reductase family enzyme